jgi:hypothetical protein
MAARLEQNAKRRAETKPAPALETALFRSVKAIPDEIAFSISPSLRLQFSIAAGEEALWDEAVQSLSRSAGVLEELAESTGEAIARIAARGDRIDRIQTETRALLDALAASEANA